MWRRSGALAAPDTLAALLEVRLAGLTPVERRTVELAAVGDPVPYSVLARMVTPEELEAAQETGLIASTRTIDGGVGLGQGYWGDVIREQVTPLRRRRLLDELVAAFEDGADVAELGPLGSARVTLWRLDRGDRLPPDSLLALAQEMRHLAPAMAERFVRAAYAAGGGAASLLALLDALVRDERFEEATRTLAAVRAERLQPHEEEQAERLWIWMLALQRPDEAGGELDRLAREGRLTPDLLALRVLALWRSGRVRAAVRLAQECLQEESGDPAAAVRAGVVGAYAAVYAGDRPALARLVEAVEHRVGTTPSLLPDGPQTLELVAAAAAHMRGLPPEQALRIAAEGYEVALRRGDDGVRGQFAAEQGWALALTGQMRHGIALLREAMTARGAWAESSQPWLLSLFASALVAGGQGEEAARLLEGHSTGSPVYAADVTLAEAAVIADQGRLAAASRHARDAAVRAEALGAGYLARVCWYAAMRYGDVSAADGVLRTLGQAETAVDRAVHRHATAVAALDAEALHLAAEELDLQGLAWFSLEAQAQALAILRRSGRGAEAARAAARLTAMLASTDGLDSPVVRALYSPVLTPREHEVADCALDGLTDQEIADQLQMSIRTVQTHLVRVYRKLGISGRRGLAGVLRPDVT